MIGLRCTVNVGWCETTGGLERPTMNKVWKDPVLQEVLHGCVYPHMTELYAVDATRMMAELAKAEAEAKKCLRAELAEQGTKLARAEAKLCEIKEISITV